MGLRLLVVMAVMIFAGIVGVVRMSAQGREYVIAVPINDGSQFSQGLDLDVSIATEADTAHVTVVSPSGTSRYIAVKGSTLLLSTNNGRASAAWEIPWDRSEQVVSTGIRISSDEPISVHVLSSKNVSSDGYRAIPVSGWGKTYVVCSYYDFNEVFSWSGGFCIVAAEDGTDVDILLRGKTNGTAKTKAGKALNTGQTQRITLNAGQAYMVCGDATTRGVFDMTGTLVTSSKPVGVIGFHARTTLPNSAPLQGRDHLIEMLHPVEAWDTLHVTTEIVRTPESSNGRGDFMRVVASEDNTQWTLRYYDKVTKQLIGQDGGILNAGEFRDILQAASRTILPYGITVVSSTKPVLMMQYSTSSSWDDDAQSDPFMCLVPPVRSWPSSLVTMLAKPSSFTEQHVNIYVRTIDASTRDADLKSVTVNGVPLWTHPNATASLLTNTVPGRENIHIGTVKFTADPGPIVVRGNNRVRLSGYTVGRGQLDSYGWPIATIMPRPTSLDTMPPVIVRGASDCRKARFEATELRNIPDPPGVWPREADQVESGLGGIALVDADNCRLVYITDPSGIPPWSPTLYRFTFEVQVIDTTRGARGTIQVEDHAANVSTEEVVFAGSRLVSPVASVDVGNVRLLTADTVSVTISNPSPQVVSITGTRMAMGARYDVVGGGAPPIVTLQPGSSHTIRVQYRADRESTLDGPGSADLDTLIVEDGCRTVRVPMRARAVVPRISVIDAVLDTVATGATECLESGLTIQNLFNAAPGTDTLVITGIQPLSAPFTLSSPSTPPFPIKVPPFGVVTLRDLCATSPVAGTFSTDVVLLTNGAIGDSVARITVTFGPTSSVADAASQPLDLVVAPNPAKGATSVRWTQPLTSEAELRVTDLLGRVVLRRTIELGAQHADVDISALADGHYVVTVDMHGTTTSSTLVVRQ